MLSVDIINFYLYSQENYETTKMNIDNLFYPEVYPIIKNLSQLELYEEEIKEGEDYLLNNSEELNLLIAKKLKLPDTKLALLNAIRARINMLSDHQYMAEETLKLCQELIQKIDKDLGLTPDMVNNYD